MMAMPSLKRGGSSHNTKSLKGDNNKGSVNCVRGFKSVV